MSYYPAWFDGAKWLLVVSGALCLLATKPQPTGKLRGRLKLAGLLMVAAGMLFGGAAGMLFNSRAAEQTIQGQISQVHKSSGRGASTTFVLESLHRPALDFSMLSDLSGIVDGEMALLRYQEGSHRVLSLEILSGPYTGYTKTSSNGKFGSLIMLIAAVLVLGYAVLNFAADGLATTSDSEENLEPGPGGLDEQSLLKL